MVWENDILDISIPQSNWRIVDRNCHASNPQDEDVSLEMELNDNVISCVTKNEIFEESMLAMFYPGLILSNKLVPN